MKQSLKSLSDGITAPRGFAAAGVFCDIKRLGTGTGSNKGKKKDLAVLTSMVPATVAGLFTTNQVCAAPVKVSVVRAAQEIARAVVANSGNANACTGVQGLKDAETMTQMVAQQLGIPEREVLVCSTGRIGVLMPMDRVEEGIVAACQALKESPENAHDAAEAILTSDTKPKEVAVEFKLGKRKVRIAGMCKGAGMIQPGMSATGQRPAATPLHATMLCFLTTDAKVDSAFLKQALNEAVALSFNRITVDGDMSTNDSVIILANGLAGNKLIKAKGGSATERDQFQAALNHVTLKLARMIVQDGEGASHFVTVRVNGAVSNAEADLAARAVANSSLVKTSWCGGDPNWGRILDALGYSMATIVENQVDLGYSLPGSNKILWALKQGQPTSTSLASLKKIVKAYDFDLHIQLNQGKGSAIIYAADLTEAYVEFNKGE
jgi:glutamate N-acetyltransferase/amino-acid N-acetyltransferase